MNKYIKGMIANINKEVTDKSHLIGRTAFSGKLMTVMGEVHRDKFVTPELLIGHNQTI